MEEIAPLSSAVWSTDERERDARENKTRREEKKKRRRFLSLVYAVVLDLLLLPLPALLE